MTFPTARLSNLLSMSQKVSLSCFHVPAEEGKMKWKVTPLVEFWLGMVAMWY